MIRCTNSASSVGLCVLVQHSMSIVIIVLMQSLRDCTETEEKNGGKGAFKLSISVVMSFFLLFRYQQNKPRSSRSPRGWNICTVYAARWHIGIRRWKRPKADLLEWKLPKNSQN